MYVILGATGHTGSVVANTLLNKGKRVRVVGRDSGKLAPFVSRGADAFVANALDAQALGRAFAGAEGVYALIPPNHTATITSAIRPKLRMQLRRPSRRQE
ncbi:MAG: NAD(P)H-binding protein [Candidatus Acidiferrum sp.]|jgi:uncharacterized protein YbjT (DUF2867 family)